LDALLAALEPLNDWFVTPDDADLVLQGVQVRPLSQVLFSPHGECQKPTMPCADRQKQSQAQRESFRRRLADPDFAEAERKRKACSQASEAGRAALRARVARWRAKQAEKGM